MRLYRHGLRWAHIALLVVVVVTAAAVFVTAWSTKRSVESANQTLLAGHADTLFTAIRSRLAEARPVSNAVLAQLQAEFADEGLRHIAVFSRRFALRAQSGTTNRDDAALGARATGLTPGQPTVYDGEVWIVYRAGAAARRRMAGRKRRVRRGARPVLLIFEPYMAARLKTDARRAVTVGTIAAASLLVMGLVVVVWLVRWERAREARNKDRRLAELGQMSAVLAHEIKNPLASLKGNAQLLSRMIAATAGATETNREPHDPQAQSGIPVDKVAGKAERVVNEAVRLEALVHELLEFARRGEIQRSPVDPVALAEQVSTDPRVVLSAPRSGTLVMLDGARVQRVLRNIVDNALAAGDGKVELHLALEPQAKSAVVEYRVRDYGGGVADDDLPRIFEPFFTRSTHGTGLGLAVAKRVVALHGGTISAHNAHGGGAEFCVRLPADLAP